MRLSLERHSICVPGGAVVVALSPAVTSLDEVALSMGLREAVGLRKGTGRATGSSLNCVSGRSGAVPGEDMPSASVCVAEAIPSAVVVLDDLPVDERRRRCRLRCRNAAAEQKLEEPRGQRSPLIATREEVLDRLVCPCSAHHPRYCCCCRRQARLSFCGASGSASLQARLF